MSLIIKNKTKQLLTVTLNSGDTLHLAPGEKSKPLSQIETDNNVRIQRLSKEGMIETAIVSDQSPAEDGEAPVAPRRKPKP